MNNAIFNFREPVNEPICSYLPESREWQQLSQELERQSAQQIEIPLIIGGQEIRTGQTGNVIMPHDHNHVLATYHKAGEREIQLAIEASLQAKESWMTMHWIERASIFLKIGELIAKKYRFLLNAATMLGQGKNVYQAEIDAACEVIDYIRYNVYFTSQIYTQQPKSDVDTLNRLEYRPLEGFVFAVSPFNFTAIALNLCMAPAVMGNTLVWKPATTSLLSNYYLMKIYKEAGLPDGVINFIPGKGALIGDLVLRHKYLAGVHFTGGTSTLKQLWRKVTDYLDNYISYPRIVGETGGKGFVFAHSSAHPRDVAIALVKGAYEYQGQKCSAASRAYIPQSLWAEVKPMMMSMLSDMRMGDVRDVDNFMNAVIDEPAYRNIMKYIQYARDAEDAEIIFGGEGDCSKGYFIQPTLIQVYNPHFVTMEEEIFGPVLTVYVYEDQLFEETLHLCDQTSPYALTGVIFASERHALVKACRVLRYAAGNFYYNDKPTGAMVGLQPFGGARMSGTNDKAGGLFNLLRWISPRTVKETFISPTNYTYPYMTDKC